jgi:hypothetical protein
MIQAASLWVVSMAAVVGVACSGSGDTHSIESPQFAYSCGQGGTRPPSKVIVPPSGGVSGRWMVVVTDDAGPLHEVAQQLALAYGGTVGDEWNSVRGFLMLMDDEKVAALSADTAVCFVQQDRLVSVL